MSVSSNQSGSQTATISTRHQLGSTITTAGVYVLVVDMNALVLGDTLILEAEIKAKSGSTSRVAYKTRFSHAQSEPNKLSVPIPVSDSVSFFLTQSAGTGRAFDWNILGM